jgi:2-keto-3-deoxy-6-phosphogluconate aldolase
MMPSSRGDVTMPSGLRVKRRFTNVVALLERGITYAKLFPAELVGGVKALKAFAGPFGQVRFCPTGGIRESTPAP